MDSRKAIKKSFFMSAIVIILCLVSLTGSTFALFTNNPQDGTIGVVTTSGVLEVDIVDTTSAHNSLLKKSLQFYTTSTQPDVLFEPGVTFFTQGFKVKNAGNININFRIFVSETINQSDFLEAFEVWILTDFNDYESATRMMEFRGSLEANEISGDTYYLFVRMKESAGDKFQNRRYTGIGVTLYAVQGNVDL